MQITFLSSNEQILSELGDRIRAARIDMPLTQDELAARAGVSISTVAKIERGEDVRFSSMLAILRALGMLANVDILVPEERVRPSDIARTGHSRKRASSARSARDVSSAWTWGDGR